MNTCKKKEKKKGKYVARVQSGPQTWLYTSMSMKQMRVLVCFAYDVHLHTQMYVGYDVGME